MMRNHSTRGLTLLECLLFAGVFSVFMSGLMVMFLSVSRTTEVGNNRATLLREVESARTAYMAVIQEASGTLPSLGTYQTGERQLVLALPSAPGQAEARRAVLGCIGVADNPAVLQVTELAGAFAPVSHKVFRAPVEGVRFQVDGRRVTVWFDVKTAGRQGDKGSAPVQFSATFRGIQ